VGFQPTLYSGIYFGAAAIAIIAATVGWRRRSARGAIWLLSLLVASAWWCFFDGVESASVGLPAHILWSKVAYLGNMTVGVFLLLFALEFTGRRSPAPRRIAALFLVPAIGVLGAATNELHHAIWTGFREIAGGTNLVEYAHGWLYWVVALYAFAVTLSAGALVAEFAIRSKATYRRQSLAVLGAIALPWIAEVGYVSNPRVMPGVDPSVTIALSGTLIAVGLLRYRLLDLVPVAREKLIERMEDGVLVLDPERRVLDANPAAGRIVGGATDAWIGAGVGQALSAWPELASCLAKESCAGDKMLVSPAGRSISVTSVPLEHEAGAGGGSLVTLRDATTQARTEAVLQSMNADLQVRVKQVEDLQEELREQAIRDPLTGLFNRRYLSATLQREIGRAEREGYPVSVVMIDADHFKRVNDEHGHGAGDQVLRFLGAQLRTGLRKGDIACRYGGDEFLMVLPNTALEHAAERARQWRTAVREASVDWMEWNEPMTLSLGVAAFPDHARNAEDLVTAADAALYTAKDAGRDRVAVSDGTLRPAHAEGDVG
jgi:diguanylate cyclase (GGDEF)-like protein